MKAWLIARAREVSSRAGALLAALAAYAATSPDDVASTLHDLSGANISAAAVRVGSVALGSLGGVLIGKPDA